MNRIPPHLLRQLLFLLLILLLGLVLVYPLYMYIPAVMGAYTLYVLSVVICLYTSSASLLMYDVRVG